MKSGNLLVSLALAAGVCVVVSVESKGALIWQESFEALGPNYDTGGGAVTITPSVSFNDGLDDHFDRTTGSTISNASAAYSSPDGTFYWAAEDTDDNGGNGSNQQVIDITGIDVSGHTDLVFSGLFAADGDQSFPGPTPGGDSFDFEDHVRILASLNGGATFQNLVWFESMEPAPATGSDFRIGLDADFSGVNDGTDFLDSDFRSFSKNITGTGTSLDLRILVHMDGSNEEIAFDNLQINGTPVPEPSSLLLVFGALGLASVRRLR